MVIWFALAFTSFLVRAAVPTGFCESLLIIEALAAKHVELKADHLPQLGLPDHNQNAVAYVDNGVIRLETDLGSSQWTSLAELKDWRDLGEMVTDGPTAKRTLHAIVDGSRPCPAGLLPEFCAQIRRSHRNFADEIGSLSLEPDLPPKLAFLLARARGTKTTNRRDDLLRIPWAYQIQTRRPYLAPGRALSLLRLLVREALIRHLSDLDRNLNVSSRLGLAMRPSLIELAPLLAVKPLQLVLLDGVGGTNGAIWLIDQTFNYASVGEKIKFLVALDNKSSTYRALDVTIRRDLTRAGKSTARDFESYLINLEWLVRDAADRFAHVANLKSVPEVRLRITDESAERLGGMPLDPVIRLEVGGLGRIHQILFMYYFAEQLADL